MHRVRRRAWRTRAVAVFAVLGLCSLAGAESLGPDASSQILTDDLDLALFNYVDITATGQVVAAGDELAANISFPQGARFFFYGAERRALRVSTNGFVSFNLADSPDPTNDCPVPAAPGVGDGGGDRMYVLHDDLVTTVRYQYFPATSPTPDWASGNLSVIQWTGSHAGSGLAVDFQLLLFHSLNVAVMQYWTVGEGGSGSTTGIQNADASRGLNYRCNTVSIGAGQMVGVGSLALNELRLDQPGADNDEYVEISGVPGFDLTGLSVVAIGDGAAGSGSGVIEAAVNLVWEVDAGRVGRAFYVVAESSFTLATPDQTTPTGLNFENDDTVTFLLVSGFAGSLGQDLDPNDDGVLDTQPWSQVIDSVARLSEAQPPVASEFAYSVTTVGPGPLGAPWHIRRCVDVFGPWTIASDDTAGGDDTPGAGNGCIEVIFRDGFE